MRALRTFFLSGLLFTAGARALPGLDKNDVEYSRPDGKPLLLDIHVPDGPGPFPAAIVVHGGGFDQGTKRSYVGPLLDTLTKGGFAWFTIDYRLAPGSRFPVPVEDVNNAIRWVKKNAAEYRVDPARLALMGESAGAYLIVYAATHETLETKVAAVVDMYGPVDYERLAKLRRDQPERFDIASANRHMANGGGVGFFGVGKLDEAALARLRQVSPANSVHKGMAPFLMIHGTSDEQVAYELSPSMCEAIRKVGGKCDLITVENGKHGMGSWEKAPEMQHWKSELMAWLQKTLK